MNNQRKWSPPRPRQVEQSPSPVVMAVAVLLVPLLTIVFVGGIINITQWIAGVDILDFRKTLAIAVGLTLLRILDVMVFGEKRK